MIWIKIFLVLFCTASLQSYQYELSLTAIFQDEAPFLKEWIEYYKLLGVEHFYLYNNLSQDEYAAVLTPYVVSGEVELIEWSYASRDIYEWDHIQKAAYQDAIQKAKHQSKWLMIFDTDEFLVPVTAESIPALLKQYEKDKRIGGICYIWSFFGTSNVYRIPEDKLLIETLIMHCGPANGGDINEIWKNGSYKSIVRPKYVANVPSPHFCYYKGKRRHIMENYEIAHINHYWTRDQFFMETHKIPRRELWGQSGENVREWEAQMNQRCDNNPILRFVSILREHMNMNVHRYTETP